MENTSLVDAIRNGSYSAESCKTREVMVIRDETPANTVKYELPNPQGANFDAQDFEKAGECVYTVTIVNGSSLPKDIIIGDGYVTGMNDSRYMNVLGITDVRNAFLDPLVTDNDSVFVPGVGAPALKKLDTFTNGRSFSLRYLDVSVPPGLSPAAVAAQFQNSLDPVHTDLNQDNCTRKGKKLFCFLCPWQNGDLNNIRRFENKLAGDCGLSVLSFGPFTGYKYTINAGMTVTLEGEIGVINTIDQVRDCNGVITTSTLKG